MSDQAHPPPRRHRFGRNQKIGIGALAVPYTTASVALFLGRAPFSEWASFVQILVPLCLGLIVGAGAWVKRGPRQ